MYKNAAILFAIIVASFFATVFLVKYLPSGIIQQLTIGGIIINQGNVLFSDDFESYTSANSPPNVRSGTIGWYHGDDGPNAGNAQTQTPAHNGADIDQSGSNAYTNLIPPTGYHRVYDTSTIQTHSSSKAVKYLSDRKTGCKVSMAVHYVVPVSGSGTIELTDLWLMIPVNTLSAPTTRTPVMTIVMEAPVQVVGVWDSSASDSWRFQIQAPDKSFTAIGSYTLTKGVWHHFQIVYDHATQTLLDIVVDETHPFTGLPTNDVRSTGNWDAVVWLENRRNVAAGETECVEDTGFQAQMYVDDFKILQLQSWSGGTSGTTTTSSGTFSSTTSRTSTTTQVLPASLPASFKHNRPTSIMVYLRSQSMLSPDIREIRNVILR